MENFDPDYACASVSQQEFGTYGWQQGSDFVSSLKLFRFNTGNWSEWTDNPSYNPAANWPYSKGWYANFHLWGVWGA